MFIVCNAANPITRPWSPYWAGEADAPNDKVSLIDRFARSTLGRVSLPTWAVATAATVAFVFLASNPVGWMATAIGVTILCAKVIMIIVAPLLVTSAATYTANFIKDSNKMYRKNSPPPPLEPPRVSPNTTGEDGEVVDIVPASRSQTPFEAYEYRTPSIPNSEDSDE